MDIDGPVSASVLNEQFKAQREARLTAEAKNHRLVPGRTTATVTSPARATGKPSGGGSYVRSGGKKD